METMIGVIADDFTGAAELGGVGLRFGLRAEILVASRPSGESDLVCLDTNSRSCAPAEAGRRAAAAARVLVDAGASWIYKKTDSVLRGEVTAELEAILQQLGLQLALLVPANPSLGRFIKHGRYFVRSKLLDATEFARDPEHPRRSSVVLQLLASSELFPVRLCRPQDPFPAKGIVVGEAGAMEDLRAWATRRHAAMLPAGGADFFSALLAGAGNGRSGLNEAVSARETRELFVSGSTSESSRAFVKTARRRGTPVFSLPEQAETSLTAASASAVAQLAAAALKSHRRVILAVGLPRVRERARAARFSLWLAQVAEQVLRRAEISDLYVEGGATAAMLVERMRWSRFRVQQELARGVAALGVEERPGLRLIVKPGSYSWPESVGQE